MTNSELNSDFAVAMQDGELTEKRVESLIKDFYPEEQALISWLMELSTANPVDRCVEAWQLLFSVQHKQLLLRCIDLLELDCKDYLSTIQSNSNTLTMRNILISILDARKIKLDGFNLLTESAIPSGNTNHLLVNSHDEQQQTIEQASSYSDLTYYLEFKNNNGLFISILQKDFSRPYATSFYKRLADYRIAIDNWLSRGHEHSTLTPSFTASYYSFFHYYLRTVDGRLIEKSKLPEVDFHSVSVELKEAQDQLPESFLRLASKYFEKYIITDNTLTQLIRGIKS